MNGNNALVYTYDKNGNIETITENGKVIKYYYDELNELIREDNQVLNKTISYTYDLGGNIVDKKEYSYTTGSLTGITPTSTIPYSYCDTNWKDKLTEYNGKAITYDAIGNPLAYDGYTYTWEMGRSLKSISKTGLDMSFKYNENGIRTEKIVNGKTTKYYLSGDKVTYETDDIDKIYYTYDSDDNLVSMNLNGIEYYYIRNAQGDIIGLIDNLGAQVVNYTYDSWGKLISTTGTLKDTVGVKNHYLYRGYRYDRETGLYYLQSRYYNPEMGRFINGDDAEMLKITQGELLSLNLFAYCRNNPVMNSDPSGYFYISLGNMGKILVAIGINPIPAVIIGMGLWKLKTILVASYVKLLAKFGAFFGPAINAIIIIVGAVAGVPTILSVASALWDCIMQRKNGIEFGVKRNWRGIPYGFNIYAR